MQEDESQDALGDMASDAGSMDADAWHPASPATPPPHCGYYDSSTPAAAAVAAQPGSAGLMLLGEASLPSEGAVWEVMLSGAFAPYADNKHQLTLEEAFQRGEASALIRVEGTMREVLLRTLPTTPPHRTASHHTIPHHHTTP